MSDTTTRAHAASPTASRQIAAADLVIPQTQSTTPEHLDGNLPIVITPALSRKEKRQQKLKQKQTAALPTPPDSDAETPRNLPNNPPKKKTNKQVSSTAISPAMPAAKTAVQTVYPLLICSIGNPGSSYANTLHSAGHVVTNYLASAKSYKPFTKGLSGLVATPNTSAVSFGVWGFKRVDGGPVSVDQDWTFWQSTSLMNVSGRGVLRGYNEWLRQIRSKHSDNTLEGRLVVVHDELESALGKVTTRDGGASAKGHNGLKSCQASLGKVRWWRVGVGIGRPESREPDVVARYVLGKVSAGQKSALERSAVGVMQALEEIAAGQG